MITRMKIKLNIIKSGHIFKIIQKTNNRRLRIWKKKKALLNLINNQSDIDKIYLYAKDPYEAKYQYLINKRESIGLNQYDDGKAFIEYSNNMQDDYKNIDQYNADKERNC